MTVESLGHGRVSAFLEVLVKLGAQAGVNPEVQGLPEVLAGA